MWRKGCNGVCFNGYRLNFYFFPFFIFHPREFAACSCGIYGLQRSHTFDSFSSDLGWLVQQGRFTCWFVSALLCVALETQLYFLRR